MPLIFTFCIFICQALLRPAILSSVVNLAQLLSPSVALLAKFVII